MDASVLASAPGRRRLPADAGAPLLTCYDDATGERAELSATALGAWSARTAALLRDGCRLGAGDRAAMLLPPHWQSAAVLLGAWSIGVSVSIRLAATAGLPVLEPGADEPLDAVFAARGRVDDWLEDVPEARHRFVLDVGARATPGAPPPEGYRDFLAEAARYAGLAPQYALISPGDPASVDGTSYAQLRTVALGIAEQHDITAGDRVLVDADQHEHPLFWLLAPLTVGASVVVCVNMDPDLLDVRVGTEGVTRVL
ncbi:TIGR03089 family protein [Solwaraspora sp. WMMA2056]|uniref:TIGR03089 family protein n=1 Tax=Solwaraspora sp. WMMA2056 TaxID=3015161 RepID=UPI00259B6B3B|nr:TIGR03089 family protein [Solwaraspora sp. WMMA2056]WJK38472.1 TIGR03089 family protein [Solwaraspora sp. WMMA2056]